MTLRGGETPGKETFYVKGGGAVTAKHIPGTFFRSGYWVGEGKNAPKGRFDSLRDLKSAAQQRADERRKSRWW